MSVCLVTIVLIFLSTLSLRRATSFFLITSCGLIFLSTLSLRRATVRKYNFFPHGEISIHALLAESDILLISIVFSF